VTGTGRKAVVHEPEPEDFHRGMSRTGLRPGEEGRSHFMPPTAEALVPSTADPCRAPSGIHWIHAFAPGDLTEIDPMLAGKWLIRVGCKPVRYCWEVVRDATEAGTLGISAKVSTDWHRSHDEAGIKAEGQGGWRDHAICIYTADWRDRAEVARVGSRLAEIDAVRKQTLRYKPDAFTYEGIWQGKAPGDVAIYSMSPPYEALEDHPSALGVLRST
jgi:hypothetical protein